MVNRGPRLPAQAPVAFARREAIPDLRNVLRATVLGIDKQSDQSANLQIGPTSLGMVRLFVEQDGVEIPMDFTPEEAEEIADEMRAAAAAARATSGGAPGRGRGARRP